MIKLCGCKAAKSIPGLIYSVGLCQEHYNMWMFGDAEQRRIARGFKEAEYVTRQQWAQMKPKTDKGTE